MCVDIRLRDEPINILEVNIEKHSDIVSRSIRSDCTAAGPANKRRLKKGMNARLRQKRSIHTCHYYGETRSQVGANSIWSFTWARFSDRTSPLTPLVVGEERLNCWQPAINKRLLDKGNCENEQTKRIHPAW